MLDVAALRLPADYYAARAESLAAHPGRGVLDLGVVLTPDHQLATVDVAHRLRKGLSLYAHGEAGRAYGAWHVAALAGLRARW